MELPRVPKGYQHFSAKKHKQQLIEYLTSIEDNGIKIFTIHELQQISQKRSLITNRLREHQILGREIQNYVNYVFNFGLIENLKPSLINMTYGKWF